ncbi:DUF6520 family protein [Algoriphagus sp. AGSA1]|uniref:DUF6520 family protein n=1 Tax=unclassified Algoriphagus TaxID=2641541 RepID=UPI001781B316|nr:MULTISPECIES: DUF6520 family protein [unclassified Algoriphagus]MCE7057586.1 DUF6520 family protein [Algoriphagus sp. AGSA1]
MKSLKNLLPALGLVFGATLAMAMNFANDPTERYAEDPAPGPEIWYNLAGVTPGPETYVCDELKNEDCSFEMPDKNSTPVEEGEFIITGELDSFVK